MNSYNPHFKLMACLLIICLIISTGSVSAANTKQDLMQAAIEYARGVLHGFVNTNNVIVTWTEATDITSVILLYDPTDNINGAIINLETEGKPNGFIQVGLNDDYWYVVNLAFEGDNYLIGLINSNDNLKNDFDSILNQKIYYIGGFSYFIHNCKGELVSLENGMILDESIDTLLPIYNKFCSRLREFEVDSDITVGTRTSNYYHVDGWDVAADYMRSTQYYQTLISGLNSHCTPTAAVNLIMYWKYGRDFFVNNSASQLTVFNWFYNQMGTNNGQNGTLPSNVQQPIAYYVGTYSGASSAPTGRITSVTFNKIKSKCDSDIPLVLDIDDYTDDGKHTVNVWGYNISNNINYLFITNNWGTNGSNYVTFSLMNYGAYTCSHFVYANLIE
ncbi:MAG: hypothetical protein IJS91_02950 [Bacteroidales bacterium]|nr:hypothetical protein [Bacteroidales bacterium]